MVQEFEEANLCEIKNDKKIYPVLNDSNFKINLEQVKEIFKKARLENVIPQKLELYQNAFTHISYVIHNDFVKN